MMAFVGLVAGADEEACYTIPGTFVSCGSHCWPNCESHSGLEHSNAFDYNHYLAIPEARSCYIDTIDYGRFDFWKSKYSKV